MKLRAIASALPGQRVTAEEVARLTGSDPEFVRNKVGAATRYFLGRDEGGVDLALAACRNLVARAPLDLQEVGLLVYVTQNPDFRLPHNSALLQHRLGLPRSCAAFDVNLGCSGYVYALSLVKSFMAGEGVENALLVTCDPYSRIMDHGDKATMPVFGDAASATWLSSRQGMSIGRADFGTDGSGADALIVRAGGALNPLCSIHDDAPRQFGKSEACLHMNGRAVFEFVMREIPASIERCLQKNGLARSDISRFALHQGSRYMLEKLVAVAKLPLERVLFNIDAVGNTVSSTIPMLLEREMETAPGTPGRAILVSGFGVGLSWATNVVFTGEQ